MPDDYDNTEDIQNMTDGELKEYVIAELASQKTIDVTDVGVHVSNGIVCLEGRIGTEEELRIIDHVMTDLIGLTDVDNQLVLDEIRRAESPEPIDEHLATPQDFERTLVGQGLADVSNLEDEDQGTREVQEAISEAEPWIPPESPTPEGVSGQGDGRFGIDGRR